jgi:hypothetical protein
MNEVVSMDVSRVSEILGWIFSAVAFCRHRLLLHVLPAFSLSCYYQMPNLA